MKAKQRILFNNSSKCVSIAFMCVHIALVFCTLLIQVPKIIDDRVSNWSHDGWVLQEITASSILRSGKVWTLKTGRSYLSFLIGRHFEKQFDVLETCQNIFFAFHVRNIEKYPLCHPDRYDILIEMCSHFYLIMYLPWGSSFPFVCLFVIYSLHCS